VVVGVLQFIALIVQAFVFWRTLKTVGRQTHETKKAADAAKKSADALVNIERPWMMLETIEPKPLWPLIFNRTKPDIVVFFKNFGRTPAWIVESTFRFVLLEQTVLSLPLQYAETTRLPDGEPVPPGSRAVGIEVSLEISGESGRDLTDADIRAIEFGNSRLFLYGFVRYRDSFYEQTEEIRETFFCLRYWVTPLGTSTAPARWIYYGPDGANKHT
jgi:hypothetical protein